MRFGLVVPHYRQISAVDDMVRFARRAEELGYDTLWVTDHVVVPDIAIARFGENYHEPLTVLAFLAATVERIRLGTSALIAPYRGAVHQAKVLSTLDHLSNGRMTFAIGAGWSEDETKVLGADFHRRGRMTREYIEVFRALWADKNAEFHGEFVNVEKVTFAPPPVQDPLPLWGAGNSAAAMKRAAELCQGWHPTRPTLEFLGENTERFRELVMGAGRESEVTVLAARLPLKFDHGDDPEAPTLFGSTQEVIDKLGRYRELGVTDVVIDTFYSMRELNDENIETILATAQRFSEEVAPVLA
ncbi:MAG: LLM class F420-dependent oxidoreductase [Dehalococcoidia bacterium]